MIWLWIRKVLRDDLVQSSDFKDKEKENRKRVNDLLRGTRSVGGRAEVCPQAPVTLSWVLSHEAALATLCHPTTVTVPWASQSSLSSLPYCCLGQRTSWVPFTLWADSVGKGMGLVSLPLAVWSFAYSVRLKSQHKSSLTLALKMLDHFKIQTQIRCSQNCFPAGVTHMDPDSLLCLREGIVTVACYWQAHGWSSREASHLLVLWLTSLGDCVPVKFLSEFTVLL